VNDGSVPAPSMLAGPIQWPNETDIAIQIAAGYDHACALLSGGKVVCWGSNTYGQLGHSPSVCNGDIKFGIPQTVVFDKAEAEGRVVSISTGERFSCATMEFGSVYCWGDNRNGQLGCGSDSGPSCSFGMGGVCAPSVLSGPIKLSNSKGQAPRANGVSAGASHTCVDLEFGMTQCFGLNHFGELGCITTSCPTGQTAVSPSPSMVTPVLASDPTLNAKITCGPIPDCISPLGLHPQVTQVNLYDFYSSSSSLASVSFLPDTARWISSRGLMLTTVAGAPAGIQTRIMEQFVTSDCVQVQMRASMDTIESVSNCKYDLAQLSTSGGNLLSITCDWAALIASNVAEPPTVKIGNWEATDCEFVSMSELQCNTPAGLGANWNMSVVSSWQLPPFIESESYLGTLSFSKPVIQSYRAQVGQVQPGSRIDIFCQDIGPESMQD